MNAEDETCCTVRLPMRYSDARVTPAIALEIYQLVRGTLEDSPLCVRVSLDADAPPDQIVIGSPYPGLTRLIHEITDILMHQVSDRRTAGLPPRPHVLASLQEMLGIVGPLLHIPGAEEALADLIRFVPKRPDIVEYTEPHHPNPEKAPQKN